MQQASEDTHPSFEAILPGTYLLKVPFGPVWTGIALVRGEKNILIDSSHLEPETYLLPALDELGMKIDDIDWLLNTLKVAIRVRTRFPRNSPPPQSYLKGVEPDRLLDEGELLEGRFRALATPGHDDDCLVWIDTMTGTAFTGDSIQANGTICQGVAFYRDLAAYRQTLAKLSVEPLDNIVCGHDYDGIGGVVTGRGAVADALRFCAERVKVYGVRIAAYVKEGVPVEDEPVSLAERLIHDEGCGMPEKLFLALHTVSEHLKQGNMV